MSLIKIPSSNNWYGRFMYKGKLYQFTTGTANKNKAQLIHDKKRTSLVEDNHLGVKEKLTIEQVITLFLKTKARNSQIKVYERYGRKLTGTVYDNHAMEWKKCFGFKKEMLFSDLKSSDVEQLTVHRQDEGLKSSSIAQELMIIGMMIATCKRLGYAYPEVDIANIKKEHSVKKDSSLIRFLTEDEEKRLLKELHPDTTEDSPFDEEMNGYMTDMYQMKLDSYEFVVLLLDLGCRHSELTALTWDKINIKERLVNIRRTKVKNESYLYLTDRALEIIKRRESQRNPEHAFLFMSKNGKGQRNYSPRAFNKAVERAGLGGVTFHTMRKTLASRLVQNGVTISDVQAILGHSTPTITAMYYANLAPSVASKTAVGVLNSLQNANK